jgi:pyruvate formate lyase activating enzyme
MSAPLIFDIKRYAINDGPGIRMALFFKGCNLHCAWCHNPEGLSPETEKMYAQAKCIKCGTCVAVCPEKAIALSEKGIRTDPDLCVMCGRCAGVCPTKAIEMSGKSMSVPEIMDVIEKDRIFFDQSGGGVTFSGGEPLLHSKALLELLDECGKRGIHRAVDTAGHADAGTLREVALRTDLFLFDLKMMDPCRHEQWTGVPNEKILGNLTILSAMGARIIIRIPLIGGINDDEDNISQTARFIAGLAGEKKEVHLLPYHPVAQTKWVKLGRPHEFEFWSVPEKDVQARCVSIFLEYGIRASIGG